jgi:hypothetical protein
VAAGEAGTVAAVRDDERQPTIPDKVTSTTAQSMNRIRLSWTKFTREVPVRNVTFP